MSGSGGDLNNSAQIEGATDSTLIGNVSDALKVSISGNASEAELATFSVFAQGVSIGNLKSMISIVNTSGSTVKIKIREIRIINVQTSAVTGVIADFRLQRITGHSAGTSITPDAHDSSDSINGSVTARTGSTVTSELAPVVRRWLFSTDEWGVGSTDVESLDHIFQTVIPAYSPISKTKPFTLNANEGFTIKQMTNSNNGTFDILILFTQE